jgi:hypothetical protein
LENIGENYFSDQDPEESTKEKIIESIAKIKKRIMTMTVKELDCW